MVKGVHNVENNKLIKEITLLSSLQDYHAGKNL